MEKRAFERVSANIDIRFFLGNTVFPATAVNISESGMCLNTEIFLPSFSKLDLLLVSKDHILKIPVIIKWTTPLDLYERTGVEVIKGSNEYMKFVSGLRSKNKVLELG